MGLTRVENYSPALKALQEAEKFIPPKENIPCHVRHEHEELQSAALFAIGLFTLTGEQYLIRKITEFNAPDTQFYEPKIGITRLVEVVRYTRWSENKEDLAEFIRRTKLTKPKYSMDTTTKHKMHRLLPKVDCQVDFELSHPIASLAGYGVSSMSDEDLF